MNGKSLLIASAVAMMFVTGAVNARADQSAGADQVKCVGVNSCKGRTARTRAVPSRPRMASRSNGASASRPGSHNIHELLTPSRSRRRSSDRSLPPRAGQDGSRRLVRSNFGELHDRGRSASADTGEGPRIGANRSSWRVPQYRRNRSFQTGLSNETRVVDPALCSCLGFRSSLLGRNRRPLCTRSFAASLH